MNPSKPTETSKPQTTNDHSKTKYIVPSKTATRESLHRSPANGVSLARILHQFARNTANETSSSHVSVVTSIPYTSTLNAPCQVNTSETQVMQLPSASSQDSTVCISCLCEQLPASHTATPSRSSENHKVSGSCHKQVKLHTSTARLTSRSSYLVPESNGPCGAINPALQRLGSQNATTTDPKSVEVPEVGLCGRQLSRAVEGGAKSMCLSAAEGGAKSTCLSVAEGRAKTAYFGAHSDSAANNTCLSAQGMSSDKASRLREDRISRLKEFVQNKEKEVERIRQQLHSLEEHKANLAFETAILESAKKQSHLHSHGTGPVSRVSKIRSKVSAKKIRLHKASDSGYVEVKPVGYSVNAFLPNFKEKGFLELLGLEVVVESIVHQTQQMSPIN